MLEALKANDIAAVSDWLRRNPEILPTLGANTQPTVLAALRMVRSPEMANLLIDHGLNLAAAGQAWADGFGADGIRSDVAALLATRGTPLSPHAAAAFGLADALRQMLTDEPSLVHALGGDGARPLHFARTREVARLLLAHGADVDARDADHNSTAAQWRIGDAPEVTRELLVQGAALDVFMAAGLGDLELAKRAVAANPESTSWRIGNNSGPFPGIGFQGRGGTIYQWTLGFNQSAVEVALHRGHSDVAEYLLQRTPPRAAFLIACARADRPRAIQILAAQPGLVASLSAEELGLMAKYCWETNFNLAAVALMLDLGFPVAAPEENHGFTPLHNAAWQGHPGVVDMLIRKGHPLNERDPRYDGTPADWALHSCLIEKRHPEGDFAQVLALLLAAGGRPAHHQFPSGDPAIDAVWSRFLLQQSVPDRS